MSLDTQQYQPGDIVNGYPLSGEGAEWMAVPTTGAAADQQPDTRNWFARHEAN